MPQTVPLHVQVIAETRFTPPPDVPWSTDTDGGSALVEFAGRACYQSWSKPNPRTATNASYIKHIIDVVDPGYMVLWGREGLMSHEVAVHGIDLLTKEVIPAIKAYRADRERGRRSMAVAR